MSNKKINKRCEIPKFTSSRQVRIPLTDSPKKRGLVLAKFIIGRLLQEYNKIGSTYLL